MIHIQSGMKYNTSDNITQIIGEHILAFRWNILTYHEGNKTGISYFAMPILHSEYTEQLANNLLM